MDDGGGHGRALLAAVVMNYLIPEQVFVLIASLAAFATVWVWLMILLSHFAMRRGLSAEERSQIAFPFRSGRWRQLLTLLFMGLVIAVLGMFAETRMALDRRPGLARAADGGVVCAGA